MIIRDAMELVTTSTAVTISCSMCQRPWQRPQGMVERRCPSCSARRGAYDMTAGEQLARDVTRYRLAIEEATTCLKNDKPQAALRVLLAVEARGRGVRVGGIIGPPTRQGSPDAARPAPAPVTVSDDAVRPAAPEPADEDDQDPIALVRDLALGAYARKPKRGRS